MSQSVITRWIEPSRSLDSASLPSCPHPASWPQSATTAPAFDGRPWNVSTGNASVTFIQHSPVGAFPQPNVTEPPPPPDALKRLRAEGLVAYEDYIAWGAVEREPGRWDFAQHDA